MKVNFSKLMVGMFSSDLLAEVENTIKSTQEDYVITVDEDDATWTNAQEGDYYPISYYVDYVPYSNRIVVHPIYADDDLTDIHNGTKVGTPYDFV